MRGGRGPDTPSLVASDTPTEPPDPAPEGVGLPSEEDLHWAIGQWLARNPIPRTLQPFLTAAVFETTDEARALAVHTLIERLPLWERCFARWAPVTLEQAVIQIWVAAQRRRDAQDD